MSTIPNRSSGARKTTVSIGEGARRKAERNTLGEIRSIEPQEPNRRQKKRAYKPRKWSRETWILVIATALILVLASGGAFLKIRNIVEKQEAREAVSPSKKKEIMPVPKTVMAGLSDMEVNVFTADPAELAKAFANASGAEARTRFVRDTSRLSEYPAQAIDEIPIKITRIATGNDGESLYPQYKATFAESPPRLIAVVPTPAGPRVDWDCYARYSSAPWEKILAGEAGEAEVRVTVKEEAYYNFAFRDDSKWVSYEIASLELDASLYGYAEKGGETDIALRSALAQNPKKGSRMILELAKSDEGLPHRQFLIKRMFCQGWVKPE